jgi:hypothetical protein
MNATVVTPGDHETLADVVRLPAVPLQAVPALQQGTEADVVSIQKSASRFGNFELLIVVSTLSEHSPAAE